MRKKVSSLDDYFHCNQTHLLDHLKQLSPDEQQKLVETLEKIDIKNLYDVYQHQSLHPKINGPLAPPPNVLSLKNLTKQQLEEYEKIGLYTIAEGKVCVTILAGGQGTRLGSSDPKGMFNIGLPSQKSLFQIFAERVIALQNYAADVLARKCLPLQLFIMTSDLNHSQTTAFFAENDYFGLYSDQITFFQQDSLPILSTSGEVMLTSPTTILEGPDGNGGVFMSLFNQGLLDFMTCLGIEYIHICSVDNVLTKLADPLWVGYVRHHRMTLSSKFVQKTNPEEKVGIHSILDGKPCIREYSEMTREDLQRRKPDGSLLFEAGNICQMLSTVQFINDFLQKPHIRIKLAANYHVAKKKYDYFDMDTKRIQKPKEENALKFELFYFDCYPLCPPQEFCIVEALREDEFAPVKNASGAISDSPDTARQLYLQRCQRWISSYGYKTNADIEISEKLSYNGKGLEQVLRSYGGKFPSYVSGEQRQMNSQSSRVSEQQAGGYNSTQVTPTHVQQKSFSGYSSIPAQIPPRSSNILIQNGTQSTKPTIAKTQTQLRFVNKSAFPQNQPLSSHSSQLPQHSQQIPSFTHHQPYFKPQTTSTVVCTSGQPHPSPRQVLHSTQLDTRTSKHQKSPGRLTTYVPKHRGATVTPVGRPTMFQSPRNQPPPCYQSIQFTRPAYPMVFPSQVPHGLQTSLRRF